MVFKRFRYQYLLELWKNEVREYIYALKSSKNPNHALLLKQIPMIDNDLVEKLLHLYMYRCKYKHAFAYIQYRKLLDNVDKNQLKAMFDYRLE